MEQSGFGPDGRKAEPARRALGRADRLRYRSRPDDRLEGSLATAVWSYAAGARMVRAHAVAPTVAAARIVHDRALDVT